jgi:drug/metabolite transporter (DMT)-like permease
MTWLYVVLIGYSLNAIALTIDKFLLTKSIPKPATYTFNVGLLNGIFTLLLIPLGVSLLSPFNIFISLLAGCFFAFALFTMYTALKGDEASRVVPYIGSLNPVFIFILATLILGESLRGNQLVAFFFIIIGGILISWRFKDKKNIFEQMLPKNFYNIFNKKDKSSITKIFIIATISAVFFALSYTLTKHIYNSTSFLNGFIWTRFGLVLGVLLIAFASRDYHQALVFPKFPHFGKFLSKIFGLYTSITKKFNKKIFSKSKNLNQKQHLTTAPRKLKQKKQKIKFTKKTGAIFLFGQACGGISFFLINYAFSLNSVTLVHALQGVQYIVLFLIIIILSKKFPKVLEEKLTPNVLGQKIIAIILIGIGLYVLTI